MYDPHAPSSVLALAEYVKPEIARNLVRYAAWRTKDEDAAKDLVADAFLRVCDPEDSPWSPSKGSLFKHMRLVMDRIHGDAVRFGYGFYVDVDSDHEALEDVADSVYQVSPLQDTVLHAKRRLEWLRTMMATLLAKIGKRDKLAVRVYELACEGQMDEPDEYAKALGLPPEAIYEVMRRLRFHAEPIRIAWDKREAQRMAGLRDAAGRAKKERTP